MSTWRRSILQASILACAFTAIGCSYAYTIRLNGQILQGDDHVPVAGATVTIFAGKSELASATTDLKGDWQMDLRLYSPNLGPSGRNGECPLVQNSTFPYQVRVTFDNQELVLPFPKVAFAKSDYEAYASVLTIVDVTTRTVDENPAEQ